MTRHMPNSSSATAMLVRGIAGIAFGLAALFAPLIAFASLMLLFAAYLVIDGVLQPSQPCTLRARMTAGGGWPWKAWSPWLLQQGSFSCRGSRQLP